MKNVKNNSAKFSFEKFNNALDKNKMNVLFGGQSTSGGSGARNTGGNGAGNTGGSGGNGIILTTDVGN